MDITRLAIIPGFVAFLLAYFVTPPVIRLAWKLGIIDDPSKSHHPKVIHAYPVPRAGGLATFSAILVATLVFLPLDKHVIGILGGAIIVTLLGLADDKWNLNPYFRLAVQFIAAAAPIMAGIGIGFISNPTGGIIDLTAYGILPDIAAAVWIVALMNFLNMGAKGVDGQLPGVVVAAAATVAALSLKFSADIAQWPVIILASITTGAYLGFLPFNAFPQKIMPGYSGSTLAGYLLAVLAILSTAKMGVLVVTLGVPLIDTGYVIGRRIAAKKVPVWGDAGHLHHRLLAKGWTKSQVAAFYWILTALLGLLALNLNTVGKLYTIVGITFGIGGLILWLTYRPQPKKQ